MLAGKEPELNMESKVNYDKPTVVIDNGTGYTKMGYGGNEFPSFVVPTAIASRMDPMSESYLKSKNGIEDLDFYIGDEAMAHSKLGYQINYPIRSGLIENWNNMERLWQRCMFEYLHCQPEEHYFMLV